MDPIEAGMRGASARGLFATPLVTAQMPDADALNAQLREIVLKRQAENPGVQRSNAGGWQSAPDMLTGRWGGEPSLTVVQFALGACNRFSRDLKMTNEPRFEWTADMWANVNGKGASNNWHVHPQAFWSAVYYVDDGYGGSEDPALGGEITFQDPRYPMNRMFSTELVHCDADGEPQDWTFKQRPQSGMLVGFPSWLNHKVETYHGDGTRISLAINMSVMPARKPDQAPGGPQAWR